MVKTVASFIALKKAFFNGIIYLSLISKLSKDTELSVPLTVIHVSPVLSIVSNVFPSPKKNGADTATSISFLTAFPIKLSNAILNSLFPPAFIFFYY